MNYSTRFMPSSVRIFGNKYFLFATALSPNCHGLIRWKKETDNCTLLCYFYFRYVIRRLQSVMRARSHLSHPILIVLSKILLFPIFLKTCSFFDFSLHHHTYHQNYSSLKSIFKRLKFFPHLFLNFVIIKHHKTHVLSLLWKTPCFMYRYQ